MKFIKSITSIFILAVSLTAFQAAADSKDAQPTDDIKLIDLDGKETTLKDYRGKWVIINLWATWCPPCLVEIPDLILFHEAHKDKDAIVLGVNYESIAIEKVKAFAESQMISFPVVRFEGTIDGRTTPFGKLKGLPTTYMLSPEGELVAARTGMVDQKMLEEFIEKYNASKK